MCFNLFFKTPFERIIISGNAIILGKSFFLCIFVSLLKIKNVYLKYKNALLSLLLWLVLLIFLQLNYQFHFYHIEQYRLFLFDSDYLCSTLMEVGGLSLFVSDFLLQFYLYPYAGAVITSLVLTLAGMQTYACIRRMDEDSGFIYLFAVLPVLGLLFMHFDFNYFMQGTLSYVLALLSLNLYLRFRSQSSRMVYSVVATFLLFGCCGSVAMLFAFAVFVRELFDRPRKCYLFLLPVLEAFLLAYVSLRFNFLAEYRFALLPDLYYHHSLQPPGIIYLAWGVLPLIIAATLFLRTKKALSGKKRVVSLVFQLLAVAAVFVWGFMNYGSIRTLKYKEMEYYLRMKQYDKIIEMNEGRVSNYLYGCLLNLALAEKGELAERIFTFEQNGPQSLFIQMNNTHVATTLLSDIYYTVGHTGGAMMMAFEANMTCPGSRSGRTLQRLVETNLIYGEYAVAEKYVDLLEKSLYYRGWAKGMRPYLYNEEKIHGNPEFEKRIKSLPEKNFLFTAQIQDQELLALSESYSGNRVPLEYVGSMYLLMKNLELFKGFIETYYGTELLPVLPRSFQEAVIVMHEGDAGAWRRLGVSDAVIARFEQYKKFIIEHKNKPRLAEFVKNSYGDTYWYYFMFKQ